MTKRKKKKRRIIKTFTRGSEIIHEFAWVNLYAIFSILKFAKNVLNIFSCGLFQKIDWFDRRYCLSSHHCQALSGSIWHMKILKSKSRNLYENFLKIDTMVILYFFLNFILVFKNISRSAKRWLFLNNGFKLYRNLHK